MNNNINDSSKCTSTRNTLQERLWRLKKWGPVSRWKRETIIARWGEHRLEIFSLEDDEFSILADKAEVVPVNYKRGLKDKYKHIKWGFKIRLLLKEDSEYGLEKENHECFDNQSQVQGQVQGQVRCDMKEDGECGVITEGCTTITEGVTAAIKVRYTKSRWYEFRTDAMLSVEKWVRMVCPGFELPGEAEVNKLCNEACCDETAAETWLCRWDELHPSMLAVQKQYASKGSSISCAAGSGAAGRRSSRAFSRARACSMMDWTGSNQIGSNNKTTQDLPAIPKRQYSSTEKSPTTAESPTLHPPCYHDVMGVPVQNNLYPLEYEDEKFQEFSLPATEKSQFRNTWTRRSDNDQFLPPYGPQKHVPINMGTGEEIGLPSNIQKMWDPERKQVIFLDHTTKTISLKGPEPDPLAQIIQDCRRLASRRNTAAIVTRGSSTNTLAPATSQTSISLDNYGGGTGGGGCGGSVGSPNNNDNRRGSNTEDRWLSSCLETQLSAPAGLVPGNRISDSLTTPVVNGDSLSNLPFISENSGGLTPLGPGMFPGDSRVRVIRPSKAKVLKGSRMFLNNGEIMDVVTAEHLAQQALAKTAAVVIDASGTNGKHGNDGKNGLHGVHGQAGRSTMGDGTRGEPGYSGGDGMRGEDAESGEDGENALEIELWLNMEERKPDGKKYLRITGAVDVRMDIDSEKIVFVSCKGGQGGNGGRGGDGGWGGNGGNGGAGSQGIDGDGGAGGSGGDGGNAGYGGNGGRAGCGGHGGIVTIYASDPRLFMLIECDIRGGASGTPGSAGKCGVAGKPGVGGPGGKGAYYSMYRNRMDGVDTVNIISSHQRNTLIANGGGCLSGSHGYHGSYMIGGHDYNDRRDLTNDACKAGIPMTMAHMGQDGPHGIMGKPGIEAESGLMGEEGSWGTSGCVRWVVMEQSSRYGGSHNQIPEEGSRRNSGAASPELGHCYFFKYNVQVSSFEMFANHDDGILEPNERVTIRNIRLTNTGKMVLPQGALLSFPSTKTLRSFPNQMFTLPELDIGESFICTADFKACIHDVSAPNAPGQFKSHVEVESRVTLLNREFLDARNIQLFEIQHPIYFGTLDIPSQMGRGEEATLTIPVSNQSLESYGGCIGSQGNEVEVRIRLDRRLAIVGIKDDGSGSVLKSKFDPNIQNCVSMTLGNILPRDGTVSIMMEMVLESKAELFDNVLLQTELYLRGRLIEYQNCKLRVAPYYCALSDPGDALFITGPEMTRCSFLRWEFLLNSLGLENIDFWDIERYRGLSFLQGSGSRHEVTWIDRYRGKIIIFPHFKPQQLSGWDICCHFGLRLDDAIKESAFTITEAINDADNDEDRGIKKKIDEEDEEVDEDNDDDKFKEEITYKVNFKLEDSNEKVDDHNDDDDVEDDDDDDGDENESGMVLLSDGDGNDKNKALLVGSLSLLKANYGLYGGSHLFNPAGACFQNEVADRCLWDILSNFQQNHPDEISLSYYRTIEYKMIHNNIKDNSICCIPWKKDQGFGLQWLYGQLEHRKLGIKKQAMLNMLTLNQPLQLLCHPGSQETVPVSGQWAQVLLAILSCISAERRSAIIHADPGRPLLALSWAGEDEGLISLQYAAVLSIQEYLASELTRKMKATNHLDSLKQDIDENTSRYANQLALLIYILQDYINKATELSLKRVVEKSIHQKVEAIKKRLSDYFGDRKYRTALNESSKLIKEGPPVRFSDLLERNRHFRPTRLHVTSQYRDLSHLLTDHDYELLESINSLSQ